MKRNELENHFKIVFSEKHILSEEYQDKYFLMKKIRDIVPDLTESIIYDTIDLCNRQLCIPIKRDEFVRLFIKQIFPILYEKSRLG